MISSLQTDQCLSLLTGVCGFDRCIVLLCKNEDTGGNFVKELLAELWLVLVPLAGTASVADGFIPP